MSYDITDEMLTDVRAYLTEYNSALHDREIAWQAHDAEYAKAPYSDAASAAYMAMVSAYTTRVESAWDALKGSEHKLVAWIADNVSSSYRDEAVNLLSILRSNTTLKDIDNMADENHWCEVYWGNVYTIGYRVGIAEVFRSQEVALESES